MVRCKEATVYCLDIHPALTYPSPVIAKMLDIANRDIDCSKGVGIG